MIVTQESIFLSSDVAKELDYVAVTIASPLKNSSKYRCTIRNVVCKDSLRTSVS